MGRNAMRNARANRELVDFTLQLVERLKVFTHYRYEAVLVATHTYILY